MGLKVLPLRIAPSTRVKFPELEAWGLAAEWQPATQFALLDRTGIPTEMCFILDSLSTHPAIAAWRTAYRKMGLKPSECRSSIEQLVRRTLRGGDITTGIPAVDLYNRASVAYIAPLGGYDADRLSEAPLVLRPLKETDRFEPLGGDRNGLPLRSGVFGYCQSDECLCFAINYRDASYTAIRSETVRALFISEALDRESGLRSRAALQAIGAAVRQTGGVCGAIRAFEG